MFTYDPERDGAEAKDLFDKLYKNIKFDKKLYKKLHKFRVGWMKKSSEYSEFLGGNTIGLQRVRFSTRDDDMLMTGIYNIDPGVVRSNIIRLPAIDPAWSVSTNPVLQTLCYTMHRFIVDGELGNKLDSALKECYYIFSYKVFGGLLSHYFKYNTTPAIAKAANERLSNRYLIKRLGTWNNVIEFRAGVVIPNNGTQVPRLKEYSTEAAIRIVNDLQGSIRDTIKYMFAVMKEVETSSTDIRSTSLVSSNSESGDATIDVTDRPDKYVHKLKELMSTPIDLIDDDILYLVTSLIKSSDPEIVKSVLRSLSDSYNPKSKHDKYLEYIILKTIEYCTSKGIFTDYRGNIVAVMNYSRGYWSSGSVNDRQVLEVRHKIKNTVASTIKRKTKWVIASNTIATIIYLFVRAIK